MRQLLVIVSVALAVVAASAAAPRAAQPPVGGPLPVFVLTGGGYGHGVGLSQWGAYGQALAGRSAADILASYYPGTTTGAAPRKTVRVLVAPRAATLRLSSAVPFSVSDAGGVRVELPAGELELGPELEVPVEGVPRSLAGPLTFRPGTGATLALGGRSYRGTLRVSSDGVALQAIDVVGLESYLLGVVPGEMPAGWPLEALKAQAVAARTYAITSLVPDKPFDLYSDERTQVYYGAGVEAPAATHAVRETRGQILTYEGAPAQTPYFSSSGGRTRSAVDVYGNDFPYLRAVDDPWDETSPNYRWEPSTITGKRLAQALHLGSVALDVSTELGGDGRPVRLRFTTKAGRVVDVSAHDVRTRLRLRSTSFRLGVLALAPPPAAVPVGTPVPLTGVARDVAEPQLERRTADGVWEPTARLATRLDGTFRAVVRPRETSTYRLTGAGVPGPSLTVAVAEAPA